jgi:hypothetical protein
MSGLTKKIAVISMAWVRLRAILPGAVTEDWQKRETAKGKNVPLVKSLTAAVL